MHDERRISAGLIAGLIVSIVLFFGVAGGTAWVLMNQPPSRELPDGGTEASAGAAAPDAGETSGAREGVIPGEPEESRPETAGPAAAGAAPENAAAPGTASSAEAVSESTSSQESPASSAPRIGSATGTLEDGTTVELVDVDLNSPIIRSMTDPSFWDGCPEREVELLTENPYSRGGERLTAVNDIVIHYVGNPGTSALENRHYFESLQDGTTSASSHFIVGLEGEIVQCVPVSEIAYATKQRNVDTLSIEVCHPDETGKFSDVTYESTVRLTAWLCKAFGIGPEHVIRHYDVTEKLCPLYYVEHPEAWDQFLADVRAEYGRLN